MENKLEKTWFMPWYRNVSFRGITVMCETKYLNKQIVTFCKISAEIIFDPQ